MEFSIEVESGTNGRTAQVSKCFWSYSIEGDSTLISGPSSFSGLVKSCTVNRCILVSTIEALKILPPDCDVLVYSQNKFFINNLNYGLPVWRRNGWMTKAVKNTAAQIVADHDLWKEIDALGQCLTSITGKHIRPAHESPRFLPIFERPLRITSESQNHSKDRELSIGSLIPRPLT